jgi:hypothetical protein
MGAPEPETTASGVEPASVIVISPTDDRPCVRLSTAIGLIGGRDLLGLPNKKGFVS